MKQKSLPEKSELSKIFKEEFVNVLTKKNFGGKIVVEWKEGKIVSFRMSTNVGFDIRKKDENLDEFDW
jgi:hypothetical protein